MGDFFVEHGSSTISYQLVLVMMSLIWARFLAFFSTVPVLVGKPVPMTVRVGFSLVCAVFMLPLLWPTGSPQLTADPFLIGALFLKEVLIGVILGLSAGLLFYAFEAAGNMIDNQRGMSNARLLIPELGTMGSTISLFLFQLTIVLYFALGGHLALLRALLRSFVELPLFSFPSIAPGWLPLIDLLAILSGRLLELSVTIAAPVVIAILVADIILGIANRVAPQINVWELSFSLKGYVGIGLLYMMLLFFQSTLNHQLVAHRLHVDQTISLLRGGAVEGTPQSPAAPTLLPHPPWLP